jgi:hypothetical protein
MDARRVKNRDGSGPHAREAGDNHAGADMRAVYFPFTLITEPVLDTCRRFFEEVAVVQPTGEGVPEQMDMWREQGILDIISAGPDPGNIAAAIRDYQAWAAERRGADISAYKIKKRTIPFFDDTSVAQIKKEIRSAGSGNGTQGPRTPGSASLLQARLFLQMAQTFDAQNLEIARDLVDQAEKERSLFAELRGGGARSSAVRRNEGSPDADNPFSYMLPDRLRAWCRTALSCDLADSFFVTASREAFDLALEMLPSGNAPLLRQKIAAVSGDADALAESRAALASYVVNLARTPPSLLREERVARFSAHQAEVSPAMELTVVPGIPPLGFLACFLQEEASICEDAKPGNSLKNTVLGLTEADA